MDKALDVFVERNVQRQDAWRQAGALGNLIELRKKLDRLWAAWDSPGDKDVDEAVDLINAAVFYIRCVEEENIKGNWPWPNAGR